MTFFLKRGTSYIPSSDVGFCKQLPAGTYIVCQDPRDMSFYLDTVDDFSLPSKLYGNSSSMSDRIINTFSSRSGNTGVLLAGEKGSGKTLLSKMISVELNKREVPTIIIGSPFHGVGFNSFIQSIEQECVLLFDEFEKVYRDYTAQEGILTLLDGVFTNKKLTIITANNKYEINEHMYNRPGRLFYALDFAGLDKDFIIEYCNDKLNDTTQIDDIVDMADRFSSINFDMLQSLVEEMNRYNETASQSLKYLNAKPEFNNSTRFDVTIIEKGEIVGKTLFIGNPLRNDYSSDISFTKKVSKKVRDKNNSILVAVGCTEASMRDSEPESDSDDYDQNYYLSFTADNLVRYDRKTKSYEFEVERSSTVYTLIFTHVRVGVVDFRDTL